jgi:hypothetical protein
MPKSAKLPLKSENGWRGVAEQLHSMFNRELKCPNCQSRNSKDGAFNKDSGGKLNSSGEGCRRFKCRSWPKCGRTVGVTELVELCRGIHPTTVKRMLDKIPNSSTSTTQDKGKNVNLSFTNSTPILKGKLIDSAYLVC